MTEEQPFHKVITGDDSISCFHSETGELYHNRAGAYTEALKNYVEPALLEIVSQRKNTITVLDVCFGLGYNSFVLLAEIHRQKITCDVNIIGLDIDEAILSVLPDVLQDRRLKELAHIMAEKFQPKFGRCEFPLSAGSGKLEIRQADVRREVALFKENFDLIFHDGFSPYKMPELWTVDLFCKYYDLLFPLNGSLLTYSTSPAVRNGLKEAGFSIYTTAAVGEKRGGTLATTSARLSLPKGVTGLSSDDLDKVKSSGVPYRDKTLTSSRQEIFAQRELEMKDR